MDQPEIRHRSDAGRSSYLGLDIRPVAQIVSVTLLPMSALMLPCALLDSIRGGQSGFVFGISSLLIITVGIVVYLAVRNHGSKGLDIRQAFLLTTALWVLLPIAGALPFMLGVPGASLIDAYFEAVSGMTTTGSTIFVGLMICPKVSCCGGGYCNGWGGSAS